MNPEPRFAWNGDSTVAYEAVGDSPVDAVYMPEIPGARFVELPGSNRHPF